MPIRSTETISPDLRVLLIDELAGRDDQAGTVAELTAALVGDAVDADSVDDALIELVRERRIVISDHAPPDRHLADADLRTAALVVDGSPAGIADARRRAESCWERLVRAFLASHRCS